MKLLRHNIQISHIINDKLYLKYQYFKIFKKRLSFSNPKSFSEKLQWLKIYDRNPIYTKMVDKYESKKIVSNKIGIDYIIPTIGIYNTFDEIDFEKLPNSFVIKSTHDSGSVVICKNKNNIDIKKIREKIDNSLKNNYYWDGREWPYKNIKPRIIIEEYMKDNSLIIDEIKKRYIDSLKSKKSSNKYDFDRIKVEKVSPKEIIDINRKKINEIKKCSDNDVFVDSVNLYMIDNRKYAIEIILKKDINIDIDKYYRKYYALLNSKCRNARNNISDVILWIHKDFDFLPDYKFFCFNGEPKFLYVGDSDIQNGERSKNDLLTHLNLDYTIAEFQRPEHRQLDIIPRKPVCYDEMISIASKLSKDIPFVRVDLYCINRKPYFSEFTFFPGSGMFEYEPDKYNTIIGGYIKKC